MSFANKRVDNATDTVPGAKAMSANKRFSGFKKEYGHEIREAEVRESATVKKIIEVWHSDDFQLVPCQADCSYRNALAALGHVRAGASDIAQFVEYLKKTWRGQGGGEGGDYVFRDRAGALLSALMNTGADDRYELWLAGLPPICDLCFDNKKNVIIHGDVGDNAGNGNCGFIEIIGDADGMLGHWHSGGEIILWGDCHGDAGHNMRGGMLTIHGNAEEVGEEMDGGKIIVKGRIGPSSIEHAMLRSMLPHKPSVGLRMVGGEIHLEGVEDGQIDDTALGGRIFVQKKLVFENGKWADGEKEKRENLVDGNEVNE